MILPTLSLSPPDSIPIGNSCFSIQVSEDRITYCSNLQPFDCHPINDRRDMLMRIGRLNVVSHIPHRDLMEAFSVSRSTVQRAVNKYREHGADGFYKPRRGRGRSVIDAQIAQRADQLLAEGLSGTEAAKQLGIAKSTFSEHRRAGLIGRDIKTPSTSDVGSTVDRSQRDLRDRQAPMGRAASDVEGRVLACQGLMSEVEPRFEESKTGVRYGGTADAVERRAGERCESFVAATKGILRINLGFIVTGVHDTGTGAQPGKPALSRSGRMGFHTRS